ncbi:MAG: S8 family serine peptidase [Acidobacteriia bacterium]|nr:S8 family serine peptidase [Terriglobia bacterium]
MRRFFQLLLLCALLGASANATQRLIVRSNAGQLALNIACPLLGCNVIEAIGDPTSQVFLLGVPDSANLPVIIQALLSVTGIVDVEVDQLASILQSSPAIPQSMYNTTPVSYFGSTVWQGYVTQPAATIVGIPNAQSSYGVTGTGIVAVIDTGVDPMQPVLQPVLIPGYDFTRNSPGGSELPDVPLTSLPIVNGIAPVFISSRSAAGVDESTVSVIDNPQYAQFGHGTMVAGVIHLVAPRAFLMPLKAFQANGYGYTSDILRAIYYAVSHGARVLNMSFSMQQWSLELGLALDYANTVGAICVASAGNSSSSSAVYPAAYSNVIAVASTDNYDNRSSFSNYGSWVWVAAPGEGVVTTYPWGAYAAVWGTSFSAPLVSGTVSLLLQTRWNLSQSDAANAVAHASPTGPGLGNGRLAIIQAIQGLPWW